MLATKVAAKEKQSTHPKPENKKTTVEEAAPQIQLNPNWHNLATYVGNNNAAAGDGEPSAIQRKPSAPACVPHNTPGASSVKTPTVQPKLKIGEPDDKYEQEADRVAEQVMRMPDQQVQRQTMPEEEELDERIQTKPLATTITPLIQRQEISGVDDDELIQEKSTGKAAPGITPSTASHIQSLKGGGQPLPKSARGFVESRIGANFSNVRVHNNARAADAAKSINARAFTLGNDVMFGEGEYAPDTSSGRRLLAHELTHVVQQIPHDVIHRDPESQNKKRRVVGRIQFFGKENVFIEERVVEALLSKEIDAGVFYVEYIEKKGKTLFFKFKSKDEEFGITPLGSGSWDKVVKQSKQIVLIINPKDPPPNQVDEKENPVPEEGNFGDPDVQEDEDTSLTPENEGEKDAPDKRPNEQEGAGGEDDENKPAVNDDGSKLQPGSKFGWLDLIKLPPELYEPLDKLLSELVDEEEMIALRDSLQGLTDLSKHITPLKKLADDPTLLVQVLLGVEPKDLTPSLNVLDTWIMKAPPKEPRKKKVKRGKKGKGGGLVIFASKVVNLVQTVRRSLQPLFRVRNGFVQIAGGVMSIPGVTDLLSSANGSDPSIITSKVTKFSKEAANSIESRMQAVRQAFEKPSEAIKPEDLIKPEDVGAALARFIVIVGGKHPYARIAVKIAEATGALDSIGRELGKSMITDEDLAVVNDAIIGVVASMLGEHSDTALKVLDEVILAIVPGLQETISKALGGALGNISGAGRTGSQIESNAGEELSEPDETDIPVQRSVNSLASTNYDETAFHEGVRGSAGQKLPHKTQLSMESAFNRDFSGTSIHHNADASRAADAIGANAFTVGSDIYLRDESFDFNNRNNKRLLAHELTHVAQQQDGLNSNLIQRVAKTPRQLADDYLAKLRLKVAATAGVAFTANPKKVATASSILSKLDSTIIGRSIDQKRVRDRLEPGYTFSPRPIAKKKQKGKSKAKVPKVKVIRRKPGMLLYLPPLKVNKSTRKVELNLRKSYDANRARLWRRLKCNVGGTPKAKQAHHVIPLEIRSHPLARLAEDNNWDFNDTDNGICLSISIHYGPHPKYTQEARRRLEDLYNRKGVSRSQPTWGQVEKVFTAMIKKLKKDVAAGSIPMR